MKSHEDVLISVIQENGEIYIGLNDIFRFNLDDKKGLRITIY